MKLLLTTISLAALIIGQAFPAHAESKRNRLAVDPDVLVKDTPGRRINLPGVLKPEGDHAAAIDFTRVQTVIMDGRGVKPVLVSAHATNVIELPFVNPGVDRRDTLSVRHGQDSNKIFVSYLADKTKSAEPEYLVIETPDPTGPLLTLQLIPKAIPLQHIVVDLAAGTKLGPTGKKSTFPNNYETQIQLLMESLALGSTPNGYTTLHLEVPPIAKGGTLVEVVKKLSGRDRDIYVYRVINAQTSARYLREEDFDGDLVEAVSIHPTPYLAPNQATEVFVLANKERKK